MGWVENSQPLRVGENPRLNGTLPIEHKLKAFVRRVKIIMGLKINKSIKEYTA